MQLRFIAKSGKSFLVSSAPSRRQNDDTRNPPRFEFDQILPSISFKATRGDNDGKRQDELQIIIVTTAAELKSKKKFYSKGGGEGWAVV